MRSTHQDNDVPCGKRIASGKGTAESVKQAVCKSPSDAISPPPTATRSVECFDVGSLNSESLESAQGVHELVPGKLGIAFHRDDEHTIDEIRRRPDLYFFSTDLHEHYAPFAKDFGPVSLSVIYTFWEHVSAKARDSRLRNRPLIYYVDLDPKNQANAAVLLGAYMMLELNMSAANAVEAFEGLPQSRFVAFRDATSVASDFDLTLEDCLHALEKARAGGLFSLDTFDVPLCERLLERCGDVSLVGDKLVAMRGPQNVEADDLCACPPGFYVPVLRELGVTAVVRLNDPASYDKATFQRAGVAVHEMHFADGSCPPPALVKRFLDLVAASPGRVAVHCQAGLGRTGTMIGLWLMRRHGLSGREAIAWTRLCRPGSVMGPQQHFLVACEAARWEGHTLNPAPRASSSSSCSASSNSGHSTPPAAAHPALPKSVRFAASVVAPATTVRHPPRTLERRVGPAVPVATSGRELGRQIEERRGTWTARGS